MTGMAICRCRGGTDEPTRELGNLSCQMAGKQGQMVFGNCPPPYRGGKYLAGK